MRLQGTLRDLAGGGLVGFLMRREKKVSSPESVLQTFELLTTNKQGEEEKKKVLPLPSKHPHLPLSAWNIYLSALFRSSTLSSTSFRLRQHGIQVLQELEARGKCDLETFAIVLDVTLGESRNWRMLRHGSSSALSFAEDVFFYGIQKYSNAKTTILEIVDSFDKDSRNTKVDVTTTTTSGNGENGFVAPKTLIRLWRGRLKVWARLGSEPIALQMLREAKDKCPMLFVDVESVLELIQAAVTADKHLFLESLLESLRPETAFPVLSLHRLFCSSAVLRGNASTELFMRWLHQQQGVFSPGSPMWDEASALRILDWAHVRMMMRGKDERLVEDLVLLAVRRLAEGGRIRQEYLQSFLKVASKLRSPSSGTKMLLEKYSK